MKKFILTTAVLCLPTTAAHTNEATLFNLLDADKNSLVSKNEAAANPDLFNIFDTFDTDLDGHLSLEEYNTLLTT